MVIQEIFGVNHHIRAVTDKFAADGYLALAPRFFDHIKKGIELGYTPDTIAEGRGYVMTPGFTDKAVQDTDDIQLGLEGHGVGQKVELEVLRGGESRTVAVVVGERPRRN